MPGVKASKLGGTAGKREGQVDACGGAQGDRAAGHGVKLIPRTSGCQAAQARRLRAGRDAQRARVRAAVGHTHRQLVRGAAGGAHLRVHQRRAVAQVGHDKALGAVSFGRVRDAEVVLGLHRAGAHVVLADARRVNAKRRDGAVAMVVRIQDDGVAEGRRAAVAPVVARKVRLHYLK